jgi:hypothetical protein
LTVTSEAEMLAIMVMAAKIRAGSYRANGEVWQVMVLLVMADQIAGK